MVIGVSHTSIHIVLTGSAGTPFGLIINSKYFLAVLCNWHLLGFNFIPAFRVVLTQF